MLFLQGAFFLSGAGGRIYFYENGEYVRETSLVLTLIDVDKAIVNDIAKDLCAFFHQESVLVTENRLQAHFVRETLECSEETLT